MQHFRVPKSRIVPAISAVLLLSFFVVSALSGAFPAQASAADTTSVAWIDNDHSAAVDNNNNVYFPIGYACLGSVTLIDNNSAINKDSVPPTTVSVTPNTELQDSAIKKDIPGCANSKPAVFVWGDNANPQNVLIVYSNDKTPMDPRVCPVRASSCTATIWPTNDSGGLGSPYLYNTKTIAVDTSKATVANGATNPVTQSTGATTETTPTCDTNWNPLSWILCPIFNGMANFTEFIYTNLIGPLFAVNPISTDPSLPIYQIWSGFRTYGNILLIVALLVVVFGQSIGGGVIDAYTARKILPRLFIAAILINLSIYIAAVMVDFANIVGAGVGELITAPVGNAGAFHFSLNPAQAGAAVLLPAGAIVGFFSAVAFSGAIAAGAAQFLAVFVLLPALLGLICAFLSLVIRQAIILLLVVVSPVAFALWVLPNTEKWFKRWWELFFALLIVYPIIAAIFAISNVAAVMVLNAGQPLSDKSQPWIASVQQGTTVTALAGIIAFSLQFVPLLLIPFAFRLAGGVMGQLYATLSGYNKRTSDAIKGNPNDSHSLQNRTRYKLFSSLNRGQQAVVDQGRDLNATRGRRARARFSTMFGNVDARSSRYVADAIKNKDQVMQTGRDDLLYAGVGYSAAPGQTYYDKATGREATNTTSETMYFNGKGAPISKLMYDDGRRLYGYDTKEVGANLSYTLGKALEDGDEGAFRYAFAKNAMARNWSDKEMDDVWATATYPNKTMFASEWYSRPEGVRDSSGRVISVKYKDVAVEEGSYGKMVSDIHKTREQYKLSSLRDVDLRAMAEHQDRVAEKIRTGSATDDEVKNYAMTADIMDSMVQQGVVSSIASNGEPEVQAAGVSAAGRAAMKAMFAGRKLGVRSAVVTDPVTGRESTSTSMREIYDLDAVRAARAAHAATGANPNTFNEEQAIRDTRLTTTSVTGDDTRSAIPRDVS